jgi:hypothetical protein
MSENRRSEALVIGLGVFFGLMILGYFIMQSAVLVKGKERTVTVKGLSETEVPADVAIWPVSFNEASNDLNELYTNMENNAETIKEFLRSSGFKEEEITSSAPKISDKYQGYTDQNKIKFRFSASATITVYTRDVELVRKTMNSLIELGKKGIAISGETYRSKTQFMFTGLNELKPKMVEEATRNAREVAEKFARDSDSSLGKIKTARQGLFSINDRDSNTPYIKKVRVVSTLVYYLAD